MNDKSDFSQTQWQFILEAMKERGIKTPLQFFFSIDKLVVFLFVFVKGKSHTANILLICAFFLILLIQILIVTSREYPKSKIKNMKLIAHSQTEKLERLMERGEKKKAKEIENPEKKLRNLSVKYMKRRRNRSVKKLSTKIGIGLKFRMNQTLKDKEKKKIRDSQECNWYFTYFPPQPS
jgi:hypothetical protein